MTMSDNRPNPESELDAPPRLAEALAGLKPDRVFVPPAVDDAVLSAARRHFARRPQSTRRGRVVLAVWAAAAVVIFGMVLFRAVFGPAPNEAPLITRQQIEGGAAVDILDAFALARRIEAGSAPRECDLDGDGVVDRRDVDLLAVRAVRLADGGGE